MWEAIAPFQVKKGEAGRSQTYGLESIRITHDGPIAQSFSHSQEHGSVSVMRNFLIYDGFVVFTYWCLRTWWAAWWKHWHWGGFLYTILWSGKGIELHISLLESRIIRQSMLLNFACTRLHLNFIEKILASLTLSYATCLPSRLPKTRVNTDTPIQF